MLQVQSDFPKFSITLRNSFHPNEDGFHLISTRHDTDTINTIYSLRRDLCRETSLYINQVVSRAQPSFHLLLIPTCCSSSQACEVATHRCISQGTRGLLTNCPHSASKGQKWTGMRQTLAAALPDKDAQTRPCGHP